MHFDVPKVFPTASSRRLFLTACAAVALLGTMAAPAMAQQAAGSGWQPGPGGVLDNTYAGFVDQPGSGGTVPASGAFAVTGWFVDKTAQGWAGADQGQVWLGTMDGGGKMIAQLSIAQSRPDVGTALGNPFWAASGFSGVVQGSSVPAGAQTLYVYMHTPGKGWWFKTVSVTGGGSGTGTAPAPAPGTVSGAAPTGTVTAPTEGQNVNAKGNNQFTITGTATDPTTGASGIDTVDVWILGERNSDSGVDLGPATLNGDGTWSLQFTPTKFPSTHVNIYVYIHSKTTGQTTEILRGFNIVG